MAPRHRGNRWLPWVGLAASLLVIAAASAIVVLSGREGDFTDPGAEFRTTETTVPARAPAQKPPKRGHPADDGFRWPIFGLDNARTRVLELKTPLRPPFRIAWRYHAKQLLEFTPVLCRRSLFLLGDDGDLFKLSRWTGRIEWRKKLGTLAAASPACDRTAVFSVLLRRKGSDDGRVVALGSAKGRLRWSRRLPSRSESSPLLVDGVLYFGTEDGTVYALRASSGRLVWKFRAPGAVKGALALSDGKLYFGTYGGRVLAIRRSNGRLVWSRDVAAGGAFGLGSGNFYSSPSVAYGRVYIGSTNGAVYSLSTRTGAVAWRKQTGAFVYGSPAVGAVRGGPPTVWIGSYDGKLYGLDARSGGVRWARHLGGKLSGSPTVIGDLVFQSSFDRRTTWAVGANTGRVLWERNRGAFTAAISDGRRVYFNGYGTIYALDPRGRRFAKQRAPRAERQRSNGIRSAAERQRRSAARRRSAAARKQAAKRRFCRTHPRAKRCR